MNLIVTILPFIPNGWAPSAGGFLAMIVQGGQLPKKTMSKRGAAKAYGAIG